MARVNDPMIGRGGAPTRATTFPEDPAERKKYPVASGVLDYFPDAIVAVAQVSYLGNEQHNAGQPLHWARSKSGDEADAMARHLLQRGTIDTDGVRHSAKLAWRALANLQKEIEQAQAQPHMTATQVRERLGLRTEPPADADSGDYGRMAAQRGYAGALPAQVENLTPEAALARLKSMERDEC